MGTAMCEISIIIPVYNKDKYLTNILDDIHKQSFRDFECILIDDGSCDGSGKICDLYVEKDTRFRVLHIPNGGVSHARNVGLSAVAGRYITFIDADDHIPPHYLKCLSQTIAEKNADIVICGITKIWDSGKRQRMELPGKGLFNMSELLPNFAEFQKRTGIYGYCCGKMFSKDLIGDTCFDERIHLAEDFDFFLRLYPKMRRICFTDQTEYFYLQETEDSSAIVDDNSIDYRLQLSINIRYKHFLEKENACCGNNQKVVSQLISNYIFYSVFYCSIEKLKDCVLDLRLIIENENLRTCGRNAFEKWILMLLQNNKYYLLKFSLQFYRLMRRLLRRR